MNVAPRPDPLDGCDDLSAAALASLVQAALAVRLHAHAPYSRFQVGAALLCANGEIFRGCNVENVSYSLTICAERVAAVAAIAAEQQRWTAMVIASRGGVAPCGACRQFLAEFGTDLRIITVDVDSDQRCESRLSSLLPLAMDRAVLDPWRPQSAAAGGDES